MIVLKDVQTRALAKSNGCVGFAYFMEMGLGKTLTATADFLERVAEGKADICVVVCPNSFKTGWKEEIIKHGINITTQVFESGGVDHVYWANKKHNVPMMLIVNYEAIRSEKTREFIRWLIRDKKGFLVLDESIQIKTHNSIQTKAALELSKLFYYVRILSGKPITQGPHDLWAQLRAIKKLEGWNFYSFRGRFCKMGGWQGKQVIGPKNEDQLAQMLEPHVFRASKVEWTDLPPKTYTTRSYNLTPNLMRHYKSMEEEFMVFLESDRVAVDVAITKYIKLAQIQSGFIINEDGEIKELVPPDENPRLKVLVDTIRDEVTGKVVIPYFHRYAGKILWDAFKAAGWDPTAITGGMEPEEIEAHKLKFNTSKSSRVIICQIRAAKYGHTLLGLNDPEHRCATTMFFENTYSLDDRSQIEDRNHRFGQESDSVLYVDLVGTPLDARVIRALQNKESVFQSVFAKIRTNVLSSQKTDLTA